MREIALWILRSVKEGEEKPKPEPMEKIMVVQVVPLKLMHLIPLSVINEDIKPS